MPTHFLFRIGPIDTREGPVNCYYVIPGHEKANAFVARDDHAGLTQVVAEFKPDEVQCEPALASAAAKFGIMPGEITPARAHQIGMVAFEMALRGKVALLKHEGLFYQFGKAAAGFWTAQPWRHAFAEHTLDVEISGSVDARLEGAVLGRGGKEFGVTLYPEKGSRQRIRELAAQGRQLAAATIATLGVGLSDGKEYLLDAMDRAYGLRRIPEPFKVHERMNVELGDLDIAALTATLLAVTDMTDEQPHARCGVRVGTIEVWSTVRIVKS